MRLSREGCCIGWRLLLCRSQSCREDADLRDHHLRKHFPRLSSSSIGTAFVFYFSNVASLQSTVALNAHLGGKGRGWTPFCARSRCRFFQHLIDLLEGQAFGFWYQEIGVDTGACAETTPNEEDLWSQVSILCANEVRTDDGENLRR